MTDLADLGLCGDCGSLPCRCHELSTKTNRHLLGDITNVVDWMGRKICSEVSDVKRVEEEEKWFRIVLALEARGVSDAAVAVARADYIMREWKKRFRPIKTKATLHLQTTLQHLHSIFVSYSHDVNMAIKCCSKLTEKDKGNLINKTQFDKANELLHYMKEMLEFVNVEIEEKDADTWWKKLEDIKANKKEEL